MVEAPTLCPSCGRPSPDQYIVCMYCATELPHRAPADPVIDEVETERRPPMVGGVRTVSSGDLERSRAKLRADLGRSRGPFGPRQAPYRLFLIPSAANREGAHWLRHRLADKVGIDLYTAGSHLNRLVPSYLAGGDDRQALEAMAAPLREAGVVVSIIERVSWLDDSMPVSVIAVSREKGSDLCTFMVADGTSLEVSCSSLAWASLGQIEAVGLPRSEERDKEGKKQLPILAGLSRDSGSFQLLDVVRSDRAGALRLRSDHFDFSCLGEERTISATVNMRTMLRWLSADPSRSIPLDEYFRRVPPVGVDLPRDTAGIGSGRCLSRELEFTEYVLILDHSNRKLSAAV